MYHNITPNEEESLDLTISIEKFEEQLSFIAENNFASYFVSDLEKINAISKKSVVLTFDDITQNQLDFALPLLKKYNVKATFFIPFSYIGRSDLWNDGSERIMTLEQLKSLDSDIIELGPHSYYHQKYATLTADEIQEDFDKSFELISKNDLKVYSALAYPYGNFPKKGNIRRSAKSCHQNIPLKLLFLGNYQQIT